MLEIDSEATAQIVDSSSQSLVQELRDKHKRIRFAPLGLVAGIIISLLGFAAPQPVFGLVLLLLSIGLYSVLRVYDARRKTTLIFYDLTDDAVDVFRNLYAAFSSLSSAKKIWHIPSVGKVRDSKYHAGANRLVTRNQISVHFDNPPFVKTNIPTPSLRVGSQTLYFFPDRILILDSKDIGGLSYDSLSIDISTTRFIEDEGVPRDARTVGQTWRYVNKKGGPDRRFSNNPTIPIAEYEDVRLTSRFGLNEALHVSRVGSFSKITESIRGIGDYIEAQSAIGAHAAGMEIPSVEGMEDKSKESQEKPTLDKLPFIAIGITAICVILLIFAYSPPKIPLTKKSATTASPPPKALAAGPAQISASKPHAEEPPQPKTAETLLPPTMPKASNPVEYFSENTPLPAVLELSETLMLTSKEYGVLGLGEGQQVTVTARSGETLTVISNGQSFSVNANDLANATVVAPEEE
ncbi:hypothetical protein [Ruficoccus amylovorans]|nr:hypothetical protein [Ruficoccus amylovorans]